ncbi:MAG: DUF882 domain-containing protein [Deltaproteobacteria bacterium]|jgi:uncharacterized protein YcbK (DUF882 family)|nr:DUF882 domain-containing protein [Deltaproteobacteria bacterium]
MSKNSSRHQEKHINRRQFLSMGLVSAAPLVVPGAAWARMNVQTSAASKREMARSLSFYNLHTGERLTTVYWEKGEYVPTALDQVNYILRDFRQNEIKPIDPTLLDLLVALRDRLQSQANYEVISGYRSPLTNAMLHSRSEGVAAHSLHMEGRAIDITLPGRPLGLVRLAALSLQRGGVGYYPDRFVHVDTGRVRRW